MEFQECALEDVINPTRDYWNGRRVLVTGVTGFKGSWLALWLRGSWRSGPAPALEDDDGVSVEGHRLAG